MQITWPGKDGKTITGRVEMPVVPFIEVLGQDKAAELLLVAGAQYVKLHEKSHGRGLYARVVGIADAERLQEALREYTGGETNFRTPVAKRFLARHLRAKGESIQSICGKLKLTVSLRRGPSALIW